MSKRKTTRYVSREDRNYVDGYGVDTRKKVNKSEEKRFNRAIKTKNFEEVEFNDFDSEYHYQDERE